MIKKIVHIADLHIRTYAMHDLYKAQFDKLIDEIKEHATQWTADGIGWDEIRIVIAGDIAHQKINISNEQLLLTSWFLNTLSGYGKVVIIPGNHDFLENNHERLDSITPVVELLNNKNIVYYKDMGVYEDDNVNWVVYSLYLCGDIHKRQTFKLPGGGLASMVGSLIQQNFGETVKHHGYGIYDMESNEYKFIDIESDQPFLHFKINDIKDIEDEKEQLVNPG